MMETRLKSIVPMFGGGTYYVTTLNFLLNFINSHQSTTDELIKWHRCTDFVVGVECHQPARGKLLIESLVLSSGNDEPRKEHY
jgi:hypothetical protein